MLGPASLRQHLESKRHLARQKRKAEDYEPVILAIGSHVRTETLRLLPGNLLLHKICPSKKKASVVNDINRKLCLRHSMLCYSSVALFAPLTVRLTTCFYVQQAAPELETHQERMQRTKDLLSSQDDSKQKPKKRKKRPKEQNSTDDKQGKGS